MIRWFDSHESVLWTAGIASVVVFLASLILVPIVVARIPADYFAHARRPPGLWSRRAWLLRWAIRIGKNALGGMLILAGVAMLVLPGQGLLTIMVGVLLLDIPGKYRVEKRVVRVRHVRRGLNWLRKRAGAEAFVLDMPRGVSASSPRRGEGE